MVKLTVEMVSKLGPGNNKRRPDETITHFLNRLTHIYFQDKHIDQLDVFPVCKNLTVIYLYDNNLKRIENFEFAPNLTHLYLQNNAIRRLENLNSLNKLTKLNIGGNQIRVVEGLENLTQLVELQIENQALPEGEKLLFDPRTVSTLVDNLEILNISGNNLDSLAEIGPLINIVQLYTSDNCLNDMKEMSLLLKCWPRLDKLDLSGNPLCSKNKYRERIIVATPTISVLDNREVNDVNRSFLQNWKTSKETPKAAALTSNKAVTDADANFRIESHPILHTEHQQRNLDRYNGLTYVMPEGYQIIVRKDAQRKEKHMILTATSAKRFDLNAVPPDGYNYDTDFNQMQLSKGPQSNSFFKGNICETTNSFSANRTGIHRMRAKLTQQNGNEDKQSQHVASHTANINLNANKLGLQFQ